MERLRRYDPGAPPSLNGGRVDGVLEAIARSPQALRVDEGIERVSTACRAGAIHRGTVVGDEAAGNYLPPSGASWQRGAITRAPRSVPRQLSSLAAGRDLGGSAIPYIEREERARIDPLLEVLAHRITHGGMLNYAVTYLAKAMVIREGGASYRNYRGVLGDLIGSALEFYRTDVATYEDKKRKANGSVLGPEDTTKGGW